MKHETRDMSFDNASAAEFLTHVSKLMVYGLGARR